MEILFPLSWYRSNDFHAVFCCFDCWNRLKKSRCCNQSSCSRPFPGSGSKSLIQFSEQPGHPPLKIQTPWSGQQSWRFIPKLTRKSLANFFWFLRMFRTSAAFLEGLGTLIQANPGCRHRHQVCPNVISHITKSSSSYDQGNMSRHVPTSMIIAIATLFLIIISASLLAVFWFPWRGRVHRVDVLKRRDA